MSSRPSTPSRVKLTLANLMLASLVLLGACATRPPESERIRRMTPLGAIPLYTELGTPVSASKAMTGTVQQDERLDVLALSGGGAHGAFGAGVIRGWTESGKRPEFDVVTGVSTGALMGVFAFLGPEYDAVLEDVYTTVGQDDIFLLRGLQGLLRESALDYAPLKEKIETLVSDEVVAALAAEHLKGRRFYVATTNLDAGALVVWDIGAIAASGVEARARVIHKVLRASAAVPGFFKPVYMQPFPDDPARQMHVDGGVKAPILLRPFMLEARSRDRRVWVIINGKMQLMDAETNVKPLLTDITQKAITELLRGLTELAVYQAYITTRDLQGQFGLAAIPDDAPINPNPLVFDEAGMRTLFEIGRQQGRSGSWATTPPHLETVAGS